MSFSKYLKSSFLVTSILMSSWDSFAFDPIDRNQIENTLVKCDEIEVKLTITHTTNNQPKGEVKLEYQDTSDVYTYFLFGSTSKENRFNGKGSKITFLNRGEYNLYIQKPGGCTKHLKFKIN